ncbi:MAG: O-antigen ligase family protein [Nitrospinaceae bacterium]|jgi:O-antigen ligase|nr:O-antigen ligase family protein [Nitrospinaceae bacterium]MBT5368221.1 O-antigen ligase family protein [Nitrospinaceae bacterium]MBT6395769.1 O-antigen ligase family protein [Nitrospinaceae bacterium]
MKEVKGIEKGCHFVLKWGLVFLLGVSPLPFGSVLPGAYITIQVVSLFLAATWIIKCVWCGNLEILWSTFLIPVGCFILVVIFQLIPISETFISWISPARQNLYHITHSEKINSEISLKKQPRKNVVMQLSVNRYATSVELLKLLSYMLIFIVTVNNFKTRGDVLFFLRVLAFLGFGYSLFAIIQKISWNGMAFWFIPLRPRRFPFGTFINKNHFASYIGMIIPLALGMLATKKIEFKKKYSKFENQTFINLKQSNDYLSRQVVMLFVSMVMILALFMSLSRGGIFSAGVVLIFLSLYAYLNYKKIRKKIWVVCGISILSIPLIAMYLDLKDVMGRLEVLDIEKILLTEGRFDLWANAIEIFQDYPLLGVGLGAFSSIFTSYQTISPKIIFTHLENDYFQLLIESGIVGSVAVFFAIILFMKFILKGFINAKDLETKGWIAGGIGSVIYISLHSLVDFSLHMPANAVLFIFIMALLAITVGLHGKRDRSTCKFKMVSFRFSRWSRKWLVSSVIIVCGILLFVILSVNSSEEKKLFSRGKSFLVFLQIGHRTSRCELIWHGQKGLEKFKSASLINPLNPEYHYYIGLTKGLMAQYENKCQARISDEILLNYNSSFRLALYLDRVNPGLKFKVSMFYLSYWKNLPPADREYGLRVFRDALMIHPDFKYKAREILLQDKKKYIDPAIRDLL